MNRIARIAAALILAFPAACALHPDRFSGADGILAQPERPLTPLRLACPDIEGQMERTLRWAWHRVKDPGEVQVRFAVNGSQGIDISELDGTYRYQRYVRQAVSELKCNAGSDEKQFDLRVRFPEPAPGYY